jgi:hypothetical protein
MVRQLREMVEESMYDRPFEDDPNIAPMLERITDPLTIEIGQLLVDPDGDEGYVEMIQAQVKNEFRTIYTITMNYGRVIAYGDERFQWVMCSDLGPDQNPDLYAYRTPAILEVI